MSPYKLITGSSNNLEEFEKKVSELLMEGYEIQSDLVTAVAGTEVKLFQSMIFEEAIELDEDYDEELEEFEEELA